MKGLVVGGVGYLGCVLVNELLERGYAVRVFDRLLFDTPQVKRSRLVELPQARRQAT